MIILSPEVYNKIGSGMDYAANAVKATIGPLGRNIAFDPKMDVPYIINSGREIVKHVNFQDKAVMVGVDVVKQAMEKAFWTGGDGSVVLRRQRQGRRLHGLFQQLRGLHQRRRRLRPVSERAE